MDLAQNNQAAGGSDDDSGKDSDEEEALVAKDKFLEFFNRTRDYWISFARKEMSKSDDHGGDEALEDYAIVLAEAEFMKETLPDLNGDAGQSSLPPSSSNAAGSSGAAAPPPPSRRPPESRQRSLPSSSSSSSQSRPPQPPLQQRVHMLQQQLQRVDLDEGID